MAQSTTIEKVEQYELKQEYLPRKGRFTRAIEKQTARIPSAGFLSLAAGSVLASAAISLWGGEERKPLAGFIGLWAPTLLLLGIYSKLQRIEGESYSSAGGSTSES